MQVVMAGLEPISPHDVIGPVGDELRKIIQLAANLLGHSGEVKLTTQRERALLQEIADLRFRVGSANAHIAELEGRLTPAGETVVPDKADSSGGEGGTVIFSSEDTSGPDEKG